MLLGVTLRKATTYLILSQPNRFKQQIELAWNCKTKRSWLEAVFSPWRKILQNSSCVCVVVYEILTALEPALPEEKIQKLVRSTQYQFEC